MVYNYQNPHGDLLGYQIVHKRTISTSSSESIKTGVLPDVLVVPVLFPSLFLQFLDLTEDETNVNFVRIIRYI